MNHQPALVLSLLTFAALVALPAGAAAQGSLTPPPGPPAPVFKTLDQVEARTPIAAGQPGVTIHANGNIVIHQPGSYYLTGNVTISGEAVIGISITANDVTLDLNGFSLTSTAAEGGDAINLGGELHGIHIRNGSIVGRTTRSGAVFTPAGWKTGIEGSIIVGCRVSDMKIRKTRKSGINVNSNRGMNTVERCSVEGTGGIGIVAPVVIDCTSVNNSEDGIWLGEFFPGKVSNSAGTSAGTGYGIDARFGTATNCSGISVSKQGLAAAVAINCQGTSGSGAGLVADAATNCTGTSTTGSAGLQCTGTASFCRGSRNGGVAISAPVAIGCTVSGTGTVTSAQKHLGTP